MNRLEGKIALITGGTSGMGEAFAKLFAKEKAEVIVVGRNRERGNKVVKEILENGGKACFMECDVTSIDSIRNLSKEVDVKYGKLYIIVNNAGILITDEFENTKEKDWMTVFDTNTNAVMWITQKFLDLLIKSHGSILNNASYVGLQTLSRGRTNYAYAASKSATIKLTQQLALNYTPKGIRVNCLCPGIIETPIFTNRDFSRFNSLIPMGRVGTAEEVAKAALFLVSDDSSYISGAILTVDGAASLK